MLKLKKITSYNIPSGNFKAVLDQVLEFTEINDGKPEVSIRLVWEIVSISHPHITYLAGKTYKESKSEVLTSDLVSWIDTGLGVLFNDDDAITKAALNSLLGKPADIQIVHIENDRYDEPYCYVKKVAAPGTLIPVTSKKAA